MRALGLICLLALALTCGGCQTGSGSVPLARTTETRPPFTYQGIKIQYAILDNFRPAPVTSVAVSDTYSLIGEVEQHTLDPIIWNHYRDQLLHTQARIYVLSDEKRRAREIIFLTTYDTRIAGEALRPLDVSFEYIRAVQEEPKRYLEDCFELIKRKGFSVSREYYGFASYTQPRPGRIVKAQRLVDYTDPTYRQPKIDNRLYNEHTDVFTITQ